MTDSPQNRSGSFAAWAGYGGVAFLLAALVRWSVRNSWDIWCTALAVVGAAALVAWAVAGRAALGRSVRTRGVRFGTQTVVSAVLLVGLLSAANFIAIRHNARADLTESHLFSLASQTERVLRNLRTDVRLLAFFPATSRAQASELLQRYADGSPHLSFEMVDPDQDPERAKRYDVTTYGTVVIDAAPRPGERAAKPMKIEADPRAQNQLTISEEKLTNALLKVERGPGKVIYFLSGHGEADTSSDARDGYSRVRQALEDQGFAVKPLVLARKAEVPADCAALVIAGPSIEPLPIEVAAIQKYLEAGGKVLAMVAPLPSAGMDRFLDSWGVVPDRDVIVDNSAAGRLLGSRPTQPLVTDYDASHPITKGFSEMTFFPLARSITPKPNPGDAVVSPLAMTSADSFGVPYNGKERRLELDPGRDRKGPLFLAVAITRESKSGKQARMVVVGNWRFADNAFFDQQGNGDFFLNAMNWLAEQESLISIRPRALQDHRVTLTEEQARGLRILLVFVLPALPLVLGSVVYWRRR